MAERAAPARPWLLAGVVLLATGACAGGGPGPAAPAEPPPAGATAAPSPPTDPGRFPSRPDRQFDLGGGAEGWELPAGAVAGRNGLTLPLAAGDEVVTAATPVAVTPGEAAVMVEADVVLPTQKGAGAGVWCRGDSGLEGGYAFVMGREGGWGLFRYQGRRPVQLERGAVDPADLAGDGPVRLRLACGKAVAGRAVLGVAYGDAPFALVTDTEAPEGGPATKVGVMATRVPAGADVSQAVVRLVTFRYGETD